MSVVINTVTIGGVDDRRLTLTNSEAARVINVGTNWNVIRIGIRFAFSDLGVNVTGTPRLYLGMLSNPAANMSNGPLGITTSHFVGFISAAATWTRSTTGGIWYTSLSTSSCYAKKIGNTITSVSGSSTNYGFAATETVRRNVLVVEITKGSPNYTIVPCGPSGASISPDIPSKQSLLGSLEASNMAGVATYLSAIVNPSTYNGTSSTGSLAVDEGANGALNAICVAWNRSDPILYISDIAWARMS